MTGTAARPSQLDLHRQADGDVRAWWVLLDANGYAPCPHGDPYCPCPDVHGGRHDPCHYEDTDPWACPTTGIVGCTTCRT